MNYISMSDEPLLSALEQLLDRELWPEMQRTEDGVRIIVDDTPAFRRGLILQNAAGLPQDKEGWYCHDLRMQKTEKGYCFAGQLEDPVEELSEPLRMTFEAARVEVSLFDACKGLSFTDEPWSFLRIVGCAICEKAELPGDYCNPEEKALLPLLRELVSLDFSRQEQASFPELKKLTEKYGYRKAGKLLHKLETIRSDEAAFPKIAEKLKELLCEKAYEPLWRELYEKLTASQAGYPHMAEVLFDPQLLTRSREEIQSLLESKGYSGTYPDFVKTGAVSGIRLEHSYRMTYFVGMEKRARHYIHCREVFMEGYGLMIQFLCGTAFLKKKEAETDVYGCLFNAAGRRLFHTVHHNISTEPNESDDLQTTIAIAVKKAECLPLTKEEKKAYYGEMLPGWGLFLQILLIVGGLFGIVMTLVMMVVCILMTAASGMASQIPDMLKAMPWGWLLAIGWIGFGGILGLVEVLAYRK